MFSLPLYFPFFVRHVDILQCFGGVLYQRNFFNDLELLEKFMKCKQCFTTDDINISKFLESKNIPIICVPDTIENKDISSQKINTLSSVNIMNNQWIKCILELSSLR